MTPDLAVFLSAGLALRLAGAGLRAETRPESLRATGWLLIVAGTWSIARAAGGWLPPWCLLPLAAPGLIADLRLSHSSALRLPIRWGVEAAIYAASQALQGAGPLRSLGTAALLASVGVAVDLSFDRLTRRAAVVLAIAFVALWCGSWSLQPAALRSAIALFAADATYLGNRPVVLIETRARTQLEFTDISSDGGTQGPERFGGHGAQFADVDGDGKPELYVTLNDRAPMADLFYRNLGGGTFVEEAAARGIDSFDEGSHGAVWSDLDADGDYDLFNGSYERNRLYVNDGLGRFTDRTEEAGIADRSWATRGVVAADLDLDGDLDLYAVTNATGSDDPPDERNELYRNAGGMRFVAIDDGPLFEAPAGQAAVAIDYDADGDIDVMAANREGPLNILRNDGLGRFTAVPALSLGILHRARDGVTPGDIDADGDLDLLLSDNPMRLYRNRGDGRFVYAASFRAPLREAGSAYMGGFADLDNDDDLDLVFPGDARVHLNDGGGDFSTAASLSPGAIDDPRCVAFADIDDDGDIDFFYAQKRTYNRMIRNDYRGPNRWIKVRLISPHGVAGAPGARVRLFAGGTLIGMREAMGTYGYLAQDDPLLHFGVGLHDRVDLAVDFPGGVSVVRRDVEVGRTLLIDGRVELQPKSAEQWTPVDWVFHDPSFSGNPFERSVRAVGLHEFSGQTIETGLFYDAGGHWVLRFTATRPGPWTIVVHSDDADLAGRTVRLLVEPAGPTSPGFVVADGPHWSRSGSGRSFVPQFVMYAGPHFVFRQPQVVEAALRRFLDEHGFNGFHVPVHCRWFDLDQPDCDELRAVDPNPDPRTFEALELLIRRVYAAGGTVHLWAWGDTEHGRNPSGRWGLNSAPDLRLQRYIAARLGPLPGWTMGYGVDLEEWATHDDIERWHDHLQAQLGWRHLLGARSIGPAVYDPVQPFPQPALHAYAGLDYTSFDQVRPSYEAYVASIDASPDRPSMSEDRFRIRDEGREKDYSMEDVRRGLWRSTMAGGVANIWGHLIPAPGANDALEPSAPFPSPEQIRCWADFFEDRFEGGLQRCNERSDGACLMRGDGSALLIYIEESTALTLDLSGLEPGMESVAVDTLRPYAEIRIKTPSQDEPVWNAPYRSDWAVAVGRFVRRSR